MFPTPRESAPDGAGTTSGPSFFSPCSSTTPWSALRLGELLATGSSDHAARLWDADHGELLAVLRGHRGSVNAVLFTADGRWLSGGDGGAIQTWLTSTERLKDLARQRLSR